ncbi:MAG: prepilin-type N-terminal cleavage/methylation domain-containing protein [Pseudomonadota bacterium]
MTHVNRNCGYTLLELIVVVAILAAVAGIGTIALRNVDQEKAVDVARIEMREIATAIRQFKQDTGYFPGQGPFALYDDDGDGTADVDCALCIATGCAGVGAVDPATADSQAWFESPLNLTLLFAEPTLCANHPQANVLASTGFNNTGRGWNGPYITKAEGYADLETDPDREDGSGALTTDGATPFALIDIPALADPFDINGDDNDYQWAATAGGAAELGLGLPYMLFVRSIDGRDIARLVSVGADGDYGGVVGTANVDDWCAPNDDDDLIICL